MPSAVQANRNGQKEKIAFGFRSFTLLPIEIRIHSFIVISGWLVKWNLYKCDVPKSDADQEIVYTQHILHFVYIYSTNFHFVLLCYHFASRLLPIIGSTFLNTRRAHFAFTRWRLFLGQVSVDRYIYTRNEAIHWISSHPEIAVGLGV